MPRSRRVPDAEGSEFDDVLDGKVKFLIARSSAREGREG